MRTRILRRPQQVSRTDGFGNVHHDTHLRPLSDHGNCSFTYCAGIEAADRRACSFIPEETSIAGNSFSIVPSCRGGIAQPRHLGVGRSQTVMRARPVTVGGHRPQRTEDEAIGRNGG